jgi:hypothetical protein
MRGLETEIQSGSESGIVWESVKLSVSHGNGIEKRIRIGNGEKGWHLVCHGIRKMRGHVHEKMIMASVAEW